MINEKQFNELHQRQKESGLTVKEFCSNEIIAPSTFYYWQKKIKKQKQPAGFIPVKVQHANPVTASVNDHHKASESTIEIELKNRTILRVKGNISLSMLKALIQLND